MRGLPGLVQVGEPKRYHKHQNLTNMVFWNPPGKGVSYFQHRIRVSGLLGT